MHELIAVGRQGFLVFIVARKRWDTAHCLSFDLRPETTAISDMAKAPLVIVSMMMIQISKTTWDMRRLLVGLTVASLT